MKEFWRSRNCFFEAFSVFCLFSFCWSLNDEGEALLRFKGRIVSDPHGALSNWINEVGVESPCFWPRVECSDGHVVVLNLKDLCLKGTLAPHIGSLIHLKSLILRNNSFSGIIPKEILNLKELEALDLGYNNFSGELPCYLGNNFSMTILLLDNNELLSSINPEIIELQKLSEAQVEEDLLSSSKLESCDSLFIPWTDVAERRLLQETRRKTPWRIWRPLDNTPSPAPAPDPSPVPVLPPSTPANNDGTITQRKSGDVLKMFAAIGGPLLLLLLIAGFIFYRYGKVATVKPWATGLSGQLQRAFVTGVPKLKRSELEAACEDFSNVIGSSSVCSFYKGTLSSGVEIAVASIATKSAKEWSSSLESQFRKKIDRLSKVSHKNFVSLLGFCEEQQPFTRMMVFEYAPNGTLFEHIHIKEAEHLDWSMRLRIAMGVAYCLEHMHEMTPPLAHRNLTSSSIYLTEDYAAKVSDYVFWDEGAERQSNPESNVYSYGVMLFEMITGKLPYTAGSDSIEDWASDYLRGTQPLRDMVDPTLRSYQEDQIREIGDVIKACGDPDPRQRPSMKDVSGRLRVITGIGPDGAVPKLSPLWWAELEILSTEAA
ncbi:hypothetical protein ACS0TY_001067 [Phlomoides rotata]